jgi:cyclopropane fatty-acyl-phospholipid synthase-like methyltransferase
VNYKLAYAVGFHPWEDAESCSAFSGRLLELVAEEETGHGRDHGRALDVGTGSAIWAIALAKRGWDVTGIDIVEKAITRGRSRVAAAGVDVELVLGDMTNITEAGIGTGYRLVVDTGTFHDFTADQREAMGRGVDAIATRDATVILTVWPQRRRPLIRGVDRDGIEAAFPGWVVEDLGPTGYRPPKLLEAALRPLERFYRLRRR